ncbi:hypothetical protein BC834DRAFT_910604, partial [Gloeopeniophorella convolvens]
MLGMFIAVVTMYIVSLTDFLASMHTAVAIGDVRMGTATHHNWFGFPKYAKRDRLWTIAGSYRRDMPLGCSQRCNRNVACVDHMRQI